MIPGHIDPAFARRVWVINTTTSWHKPAGQWTAFAFDICGAGGGGGGGASAGSARGGAGGGAGYRMQLIVPAIFVPDTIDITVGIGGTGGASINGGGSGVAGNNATAGEDTVLSWKGFDLTRAGAGGGGNGGGTSGAGTAGSAGVIGTNGFWHQLGGWRSQSAQAGVNGSPTPQNPSGGAGTSTIGSTGGSAQLLGAYAGGPFSNLPSASQDAGHAGNTLWWPAFFSYGGGCGAGNAAVDNATKSGGDGGWGSGGGGGAPADASNNSGPGGRGGDGYVIITGW